MRKREDKLLEHLREQERALHEKLVETTHFLNLARQEVESYESTLEMTMAQLNHVRRQMDVLWQAAP